MIKNRSQKQKKAAKLSRARPDWAYEFSDRTGPDTQICRTGPAGQVLPDRTKSGLTFYYTKKTTKNYEKKNLKKKILKKKF